MKNAAFSLVIGAVALITGCAHEVLYAPVGPALFRYGFAFSVGLTLLPIPLAILSWGVRLLRVFG